jgi:hypothetical protein
MPHEKELSTRWILGWMAWTVAVVLLLSLAADVMVKSAIGNLFDSNTRTLEGYEDYEGLYFDETEWEDVDALEAEGGEEVRGE